MSDYDAYELPDAMVENFEDALELYDPRALKEIENEYEVDLRAIRKQLTRTNVIESERALDAVGEITGELELAYFEALSPTDPLEDLVNAMSFDIEIMEPCRQMPIEEFGSKKPMDQGMIVHCDETRLELLNLAIEEVGVDRSNVPNKPVHPDPDEWR